MASEERVVIELAKYHIWYAKDANVEVFSNGDQFITEIQSILGDSYLSVGYSCPNYAWIEGFTLEQISKIAKAIDDFWANVEKKKDMDMMLPTMLEMCKIANKVYNEII